jgi:hypothetical protein
MPLLDHLLHRTNYHRMVTVYEVEFEMRSMLDGNAPARRSTLNGNELLAPTVT